VSIAYSDDYRKLVKFLNNSNFQYHSLRDPKSKSAILRNIPIDYTVEEISAELSAEISVLKVFRFYRQDRSPTPLCAVEVKDSHELEKLFKVNRLFNSITVELLRKTNTIVQCKRSQELGHTKNYCKLAFRCIICGQNHNL